MLLVVVSHWFPTDWAINWTPNGSLGVDLFFALSGFLITSILLVFRSAVDGGTKTFGRALGDFYVRRSLRLFPLYYAVLLVFYLWPADVTGTGIRQAWPWFALFAQNFRMFATQEWHGSLSHFWSLAVEEQFYLIWGVAVLLLPVPRLRQIALAGVVTAVVFRVWGVLAAGGDLQSMGFWAILTPSCFDGLALGSMLALCAGTNDRWESRLRRAAKLSILPALALVGCYRWLPVAWYALGRTAVCLAAVGLLFWAIDGRAAGGVVGRILESTPVTEFGRRSYGLYVFHNLVPFFTRSVVGAVGKRVGFEPSLLSQLAEPPMAWLLWSPLLLLLAFGSWRFFEAPINALKSRFAP